MLSHSCKDNGIPKKDDTEGWPNSAECRTLNQFLCDDSNADSIVPTEETAHKLNLWQFLEENLAEEKKAVPFISEEYCNLLMKRVYNHQRLVVDLKWENMGKEQPSVCS